MSNRLERRSLASGLLAGAFFVHAAFAGQSPKAVLDAYLAGVNGGDMHAVEALIAPHPGRPPRNFCPAEMPDRECLLSYLEQTVVTQHTQLLPLKTTAAGSTVVVTLEVRNDLTRAAGVERFTGTDHIKVNHGKIVDFAFVPDSTDPQTVRFFKYMRSTLNSRPGGGPPQGSLPGDSPATP
jgi:hypothetical protein